MKIRYILLCFGFLGLAACATLQVPDDFIYTEIETSAFDFATWQKISDKSAPYKVYIEGDGFAFNAHGQPTSDPTPLNTLVRELAFGDTHPNVIYMARACQFVQHKQCAQKYWTIARFAPEVVAAQADALKQIVGSAPVTLVGFSGGAQVAALITVLHPEINVRQIITIAGNLDHPAWTTHHNVPPLTESLDLNAYRAKFAKFKQIHYVGADDVIMPPALNRAFAADKSSVIEVKDATHNSGWNTVFAEIRAK